MSDRLGPITYGSTHDEVFLGRDFTTSRNYSEKVASKSTRRSATSSRTPINSARPS
jgi:ATP-dependent Zn protease